MYIFLVESLSLQDTYQFVWLAGGRIDIQMSKQEKILNKYINAIAVYKLNDRVVLRDIEYLVHPLYMN